MVFHILNLNASYKSWDLGCCLGNKAQRYFDDDIVLDNLKIAKKLKDSSMLKNVEEGLDCITNHSTSATY